MTTDNHVMIDVECLGVKPDSALLAIGAVKFNPREGELISSPAHQFYSVVLTRTHVALGAEMYPDAVMWWIGQPPEVRAAVDLNNNPQDIHTVLHELGKWIGEDNGHIWGNGAGFDNAILANAYERAKMKLPWTYKADRCYRTLKSMYPDVEFRRVGTLHNALDDARSQALHLQRIFRERGL